MNLRYKLQKVNSICSSCGYEYNNPNYVNDTYIYYLTNIDDFTNKISLNKICKECHTQTNTQFFIKYNLLQHILLDLKTILNRNVKIYDIKSLTELYMDYIFFQHITSKEDIDNTLTAHVSLTHKEYLELCDTITIYNKGHTIQWIYSVQT